jgi:hypothetical protein
VHGGFKRKARAGGGLVEERSHNALLKLHRASMGHDLFHILGSIKEMKKRRCIKLLSFDDVMQFHGGF